MKPLLHFLPLDWIRLYSPCRKNWKNSSFALFLFRFIIYSLFKTRFGYRVISLLKDKLETIFFYFKFDRTVLLYLLLLLKFRISRYGYCFFWTDRIYLIERIKLSIIITLRNETCVNDLIKNSFHPQRSYSSLFDFRFLIHHLISSVQLSLLLSAFLPSFLAFRSHIFYSFTLRFSKRESLYLHANRHGYTHRDNKWTNWRKIATIGSPRKKKIPSVYKTHTRRG